MQCRIVEIFDRETREFYTNNITTSHHVTPNSRGDWIIACFDQRMIKFPKVDITDPGLATGFLFGARKKSYSKSFIDQACSVKMAGYWPRSRFKETSKNDGSSRMNVFDLVDCALRRR